MVNKDVLKYGSEYVPTINDTDSSEFGNYETYSRAKIDEKIKAALENTGYDWSGKTIIFDGDSLTAGYGLPETVGELLGLGAVHNVAISGVGVTAPEGSIGYWRTRLNNYTYDADAIVIMGDINPGSAAGSVTDTGESAWYGRWKLFLGALRKMYPTIPIFLIATFANIKSGTYTFGLAFYQLAAMYACVFINLANESQVGMIGGNAGTAAAFSITGKENVHMRRDIAAKYMYPLIAKKIKEYIPIETDTPDTGISLDQTAVSLAVGESVTLTAALTPATTINQTNVWNTGDTGVALVVAGEIIGVAEGTCTVTVTTKSGHQASCTVTVTAAT